MAQKHGFGFNSLQQVIELALDRVEQNETAIKESAGASTEHLKQVRRILIRDAYFLQKEKTWLDQERQKLNQKIL
jgi:hypothetical protein